MTDPISTGLEVVAGAVSGLPAPVQTSFFKALSDLLGGLTAIPAAKLKQYAQGIEDTTTARSAVAAMVAKAAGEGEATNPLLMQAAAEVYLPTALRKAKNRICVAQRAAEHISEEAGNGKGSAPPDDDWMNTFSRFAEDASSEKLQDLFGRILAGQVVRPGAFAPSTIRAVSELDQAIAADFAAVWERSVGHAIDPDPESSPGDAFARWKRLAEAGLISAEKTGQYAPSATALFNGNSLWTPASGGSALLLIHFQPGKQLRWDNIEFTRAGRELGSILAQPDYLSNLRALGAKMALQDVVKIELYNCGTVVEVIPDGNNSTS